MRFTSLFTSFSVLSARSASDKRRECSTEGPSRPKLRKPSPHPWRHPGSHKHTGQPTHARWALSCQRFFKVYHKQYTSSMFSLRIYIKITRFPGLHLLGVNFSKPLRLGPVDVGGCELRDRVVHEHGVLIEERSPRLGFSSCQGHQGKEQYPYTAHHKRCARRYPYTPIPCFVLVGFAYSRGCRCWYYRLDPTAGIASIFFDGGTHRSSLAPTIHAAHPQRCKARSVVDAYRNAGSCDGVTQMEASKRAASGERREGRGERRESEEILGSNMPITT